MANEITITASLSALKAAIMSSTIGRSVTSLTFNMNGLYYSEGSITVLTTATVIPLGQVLSPHWSFFRNLDATNYCTIRNGSSGADLIKLFPGECAFVPLSDASVPNALANAASIQLEYLILSL